MKNKQKIVPSLWFDSQAEDAAAFYVSLFKGSGIIETAYYGEAGAKVSGKKKGSVMTVTFALKEQEFLALNGGPDFKFTPAVSLMAHCKTKPEIDRLFKKLSDGGEILMPLDKYPFSERFAFIKDRYGLAWQLILSPPKHHIAPTLLFVGKDLGKAEAAVLFYSRVFKGTKIEHIERYTKGEEGKEGTVKHSSFSLFGQEFMAMDGAGPHAFGFNESLSFMVYCDTQEEIDYYWKALTEKGEEVQCGWLKDQFGVSWQIVPRALDYMMSQDDIKRSDRVMAAMIKMKKLDINGLERAYAGK